MLASAGLAPFYPKVFARWAYGPIVDAMCHLSKEAAWVYFADAGVEEVPRGRGSLTDDEGEMEDRVTAMPPPRPVDASPMPASLQIEGTCDVDSLLEAPSDVAEVSAMLWRISCTCPASRGRGEVTLSQRQTGVGRTSVLLRRRSRWSLHAGRSAQVVSSRRWSAFCVRSHLVVSTARVSDTLCAPLSITVIVVACASLTARCGDILVHVSALELLHDVLSACLSVVHSAPVRHAAEPPVATSATASTTIMEVAVTPSLGCGLRSLRDVIYHSHGVLSDADMKYLTQFNAPYSLQRHDSGRDGSMLLALSTVSNQHPRLLVAPGVVDLAKATLPADTPAADSEQHVGEMFQFLEGMASSDHTPVVRADGVLIGGDRRSSGKSICLMLSIWLA